MVRYLVPTAAAVVLLIGTAIIQGTFTERWTTREATEEQKAFAGRLQNAPISVGDWQSIEIPVDERQKEASRSVGTFSRIFQNKLNPKKIVNVFIVCGHPRDVTLHTPDQCYVLNGFSEVEEAHKYPVDTKDSKVAWFWTNRFRKGASYEGPEHLRIFWSFNEKGEWVSPTIARVELMNAPALYKIYAITEVAGDSRERPDESAAVEFLREFIPALDAVLFPKPGEAPAKPGEESPDSAAPASPIGTPEGLTAPGVLPATPGSK